MICGNSPQEKDKMLKDVNPWLAWLYVFSIAALLVLFIVGYAHFLFGPIF
jgi:hypothetical protein